MKISLRGRRRKVEVVTSKKADQACSRNMNLPFGKKRQQQALRSVSIRSLAADIISIFRLGGLGKKR